MTDEQAGDLASRLAIMSREEIAALGPETLRAVLDYVQKGLRKAARERAEAEQQLADAERLAEVLRPYMTGRPKMTVSEALTEMRRLGDVEGVRVVEASFIRSR